MPGDYGKVRPMVVVQSDELPAFGSILICPLTTDIIGLEGVRMVVAPTVGNGLDERSEIMVEKLSAIDRKRLRRVIGCLPEETCRRLDARLSMVLGLGNAVGDPP